MNAIKPVQRKKYKMGAGLAGIALVMSGCSASSAPASSVTSAPASSVAYPTAPAVPKLSLVNTPQSKAASYLINSLSIGGSAAVAKVISPTVLFHTNGLMFALEGCRLTSGWYSSGANSVLSGESTCPDGDMVALDVTFDAKGKITKVLGQGSNRTFDSRVSTNPVY